MDTKDDYWRTAHALSVALLPYREYNTTFTYERYGQVVRDIRAEKRMTQAKLAKALGWTPVLLYIVEHGHQEIPLHMYVEICKALEVSLDELVTRAEKYTKRTLPRLEPLPKVKRRKKRKKRKTNAKRVDKPRVPTVQPDI